MQTRPASTATQSAHGDAICAVIRDVIGDIGTAAHVTLALPRDSEQWEAFCTSPIGEALIEIEQSSGGPALDAFWSGHIARIPSTLCDRQWPEYSKACTHMGVGSVTAFPISINGVRVGVLTVTSKDGYVLGPEETSMGVRAAARAANILVGRIDCG